MRGEDGNQRYAQGQYRGSPPHARGRLGPVESELLEFGITPACAGKTTPQMREYIGE